MDVSSQLDRCVPRRCLLRDPGKRRCDLAQMSTTAHVQGQPDELLANGLRQNCMTAIGIGKSRLQPFQLLETADQNRLKPFQSLASLDHRTAMNRPRSQPEKRANSAPSSGKEAEPPTSASSAYLGLPLDCAIVMLRCSVGGELGVEDRGCGRTYSGKGRRFLDGLQGRRNLSQMSTNAHVKNQPKLLVANGLRQNCVLIINHPA